MLSTHLAIDLGAETAKVFLGTFNGEIITTEEIHRFKTGILSLSGRSHWNIYRFWEKIVTALEKAVQHLDSPLTSIGIDTWGVDYAWIKKDDHVPRLPFSYRDLRTSASLSEFAKKADLNKVYKLTGVQLLPINTLFQLFAEKNEQHGIPENENTLLFIPDIFNYFLTGKKVTEFTFATTSQLYNPAEGNWEKELFEMLGIPQHIMQQILPPCSVIGNLKPELAFDMKLQNTVVVVPATHDTASAIAAIPAEGRDWAYISTGTWALVGIESEMPVINDLTYRYNITNEGGMAGFRLLKNMMGLWLLQRCRKAWGEEDFSYEMLMQMAEQAMPFSFFIDPDHYGFFNPPDMPEAIADYCRKTGQEVPVSKGEMVRGILESLALKTRLILNQISEATSVVVNKIYLTGGGVHNTLLCQLTANATGLPVISTWADSTAIGNLLGQLIACGRIKNLEEGRAMLRKNAHPTIYQPENQEKWNTIFEKFRIFIDQQKK